MSFNKISVVGLGYIGLPTAAVFASKKMPVIGIDVNAQVIDTINRGAIHIVEPDLDTVVKSVVSEGYLKASINAEPADAFLIAVPTPFKSTNDGSNEHEPDLSYIQSASALISSVLKKGDLVILESTSPVGATEQMAEWLATLRPDLTFPQTHGEESDIRIAHCPERVLPGHVLRELVQNDRVIGGMTPRCSARAVELYKIVVEGECVITNTRTAEMAKLTENSFRDVNIAFANELSVICEELNINVWELIQLANRHPRVNILQPGPGVGGHCIAVDPWFIVSKTPDKARLIHTARLVNDDKPIHVINNIKNAVARTKALKSDGRVKVACFGLSFKPNIDDIRESPALSIVKKLSADLKEDMMVVEPYLDELPDILKGEVRKVSLEEAYADADILVMLVDHDEFRQAEKPDSSRHFLIDARGVWN
ncbi:UDP-N-acetyl-D-mannosamine dehydrogenase [Brucellaceae bacterium C25G]